MSDQSINSNEFNEMFGEALSRGGELLEKVAEVTGLYIQQRLRENAFSRQILPPQTVTVAELTRNENDESLVYIDDIEPESKAMRINMRGEPDKRYIEGNRYSIRMETISSEKFQKSEDELRSYRMPITKIIEQNTVKDIQEVQDQKFMEHVRAAIMFATRIRHNDLVAQGVVRNTLDAAGATDANATGDSKNLFNADALASYLLTRRVTGVSDGGALTDASAPAALDPVFPAANYNPADAFYSNIILSEESEFTRRIVRLGAKIGPARELRTSVFLLHEYDWADAIAWTQDDAGLELLKEIVVDGYKYTKVGGYTFVTTIRANAAILEPGQIYCFPAPEFLGRFLVLQNTQFYINKEGRFFNMEAWETCGIGFGNIQGIGLILLAGASVRLPNLFIASDGAVQLETGMFTLVNDKDNPIR